LWAGVMSLAMKHVYDRDILPALRSFIDMLKKVECQHGGDDFVVSLLYYLYQRGETPNEDQFHELITTELPSDIGKKAMTLAELRTQKGIKQGEHNARSAIAQNLLLEGLEPTLVAKTTGVALQTIKEMAAAIETQKDKV
jgi:predicted transposase YdaD